jgi:serine/threonine protein phosphatase PrpC
LIAGQRNFNIYAVADGHGPSGHFVSHLIVDNLYSKIDHHLKQTSDI